MPQFENNSFDYVILNHVLEHVQNEKNALDEIWRVLKENGKFIFSMPIAVDRNTYESEEFLTEKEKLKLYGQEDHCRLYGKDVGEHIANWGYKVDEYRVDNILNTTQIKHNRMLEGDRIFIGTKICQ